jgi:hypothetical protein
MRWAGHAKRISQTRYAYTIFVGNPKKNEKSWEIKNKSDDDVNSDSRETWYDDTDWIQLAQNRVQWRDSEAIKISNLLIGTVTMTTLYDGASLFVIQLQPSSVHPVHILQDWFLTNKN